MRAAALEALVAAGRASFSVTDLSEALCWLSDEAREATVRSLRQAGWLDYDASRGTTITDAGWGAAQEAESCRGLRARSMVAPSSGCAVASSSGTLPGHTK